MELKAVSPTGEGPAQNFTRDVYVTPIYSGQEPSRMTVALVRFTPTVPPPPGTGTRWARPSTSPTASAWSAPATVRSCGSGPETRSSAPDEEHWQGAAADTFMSHLAMLPNLPGGEDPTT